LKRETSNFIISTLEDIYPNPFCALEYEGEPWKLLMMSILSAQCTDKRVNIVSKKLFEALPSTEAIANATIPEIENLIKECGLYHAKAKSLKSASEDLINNFNNIVPDNIEDLLTLRGVGRKIANLIVGDIYKKPAIVCDTHCIRLSSRLGYTPLGEKNPLKTEKKLKSIIPPEKQSDFCHRLVMFGRDRCFARSPQCEGCPFETICKYRIKNMQ